MVAGASWTSATRSSPTGPGPAAIAAAGEPWRYRGKSAVKKKNCRHARVFRKRGPTTEKVVAKDIDNEGRCRLMVADAMVVWQVCIRCGNHKHVPFRKDPG